MPVLSFKVSAAEAHAIRARARAEKKTVSAYLRKQALPAKKKKSQTVSKKHPVSGLTYDATPGTFVTDEDVRAALADFP